MEKIIYRWRPGEDSVLVGRDAASLNPKELMLAALARCSAMTAAALFHKMQLTVSELRVEASGELAGPPELSLSLFTGFHVAMHALAPAEEHDKARHAMQLTADKYCGVGRMYTHIGPVQYDIKVE